MTRRKFVYSFLGCSAAAATYPCVLEPRWLDVSHTRVQLRATPLSRPLRVLQISDLHYSWAVPLHMIDDAVSRGLATRPDLICVTGDFITHAEDPNTGDYARVLSRLSAAAPAFAIMGNHDGGVWAQQIGGHGDHRAVDELLRRSGIRLLHNESVALNVKGTRLTLAGVGDFWSNEIDAERAFAGVDASDPVVLMSHNPDSKDLLVRQRWDLMLSGHTHGGQVLVPFVGPHFAPVQDKRYVAGLGRWRGRQIYVTRGVGNLGSVRFRCRPEVSVLTLG